MNGLQIPFTGIRRQYNNLRSQILDVTDEVLRSGQLMDGNYTAEFENWLAKKNNVKYAVTCHSCSQALEIVAQYYITQSFVPKPPRVLIPAMTYVATVNAFMRAGWTVTLVDTDAWGQMDHKKIDRAESVQATVAVGLYGQSLNKHEYLNNNSIVIEDGAQHWLSNDCNRIGNVTAISFDPMKNFNNYGNGGAIVTDDFNLLDFARSWRNNGKPNHSEVGTNSRMSEIDCAQMMIKTHHIDTWQARRKKIAGYWLERLRGTPVRTLINETNHRTHAVNKFVIDVANRDLLKRNLEIRRIETKILNWEPLHELPAYDHHPGPDVLSVASALSRRTMCLPIYPELTDLEVEYIVDQVIDCVKSAH